jgi:hypothetical protein
MKRTLTFEFDDDDGDSNFNMITHASDMYFVLYEMDQWLRSQIKYNESAYDDKQIETLEKVREQLREFIEQHNFNLDMVD